MLRIDGATDKGRVRATNEDHFAIDHDLDLCVIADGMGGHNAGEIAATIAVDAVLDFLRDRSSLGWPFGFDPCSSEPANRLRTAIQLANLRVLEVAGSSSEYAGMGTTLVAALVTDERVTVGHVGDSRLYWLSAAGLRQLTHDDSWAAGMLARDPHASAVRLRHHPLGTALTNVVGTRTRTEVHLYEETLADGDILLMTTDGVHEMLDTHRLERLLVDNVESPDLAETIVRTAVSRGARDNCTAIVARYVAD